MNIFMPDLSNHGAADELLQQTPTEVLVRGECFLQVDGIGVLQALRQLNQWGDGRIAEGCAWLLILGNPLLNNGSLLFKILVSGHFALISFPEPGTGAWKINKSKLHRELALAGIIQHHSFGEWGGAGFSQRSQILTFDFWHSEGDA